MDKKTIQKAELCIKTTQSERLAILLSSALEKAKRGDKQSELLVDEAICAYFIGENYDKFYEFVELCRQHHADYAQCLDALKNENWGKPLVLARAVQELNRGYERAYKDARNCREGFKKSNQNFRKSSKKLQKFFVEHGVMHDRVQVSGMLDHAPGEEILFMNEQPSAAEVAKREKVVIDQIVAEMDHSLNLVRADMRADFSLGAAAIDVVNELAMQKNSFCVEQMRKE